MMPFTISNKHKLTSADQNLQELNNLFIYKLEYIYAIQKYLTLELPCIADLIFTEDLKSVLEAHRHITTRQIIRLKAIFDRLHIKPRRRHAVVTKKMIREIKWPIKRKPLKPAIVDTGFIIAWRGIHHYNIAAYAGLVNLSTTLKLNKIAESLFKAMDEEMDADSKLRALSSGFYFRAISEGQDEHGKKIKKQLIEK